MSREHVMTSETHRIRVDLLPGEHTRLAGRLGMTFAPGMKAVGGRGRWDLNLGEDLRVLREEYETDVLVSVMEEHEYKGYGIAELLEAVVRLGGDADTNGAVARALLGARFGLGSIPNGWLRALRGKDELLALI